MTLWGAIEEGCVSPTVGDALKLALFTGLRPGETSGIAITEIHDIEIDGRARVEIPATRMKARRGHTVPLAPMARSLVQDRLRTVAGMHLFQSRVGGRDCIARHTLSQGLRHLIINLQPAGSDADVIAGLQADRPTVHDLRRTVASGLSELGVLREDRLCACDRRRPWPRL